MAGLAVMLMVMMGNLFLCAPAVAIPVCNSSAVQGRTRFAPITCTWPSEVPTPSQSSMQLMGSSQGVFPGILLHGPYNITAELQPTAPGLSLTIKRVVFLNTTVAPPTNTTAPKLLPLGLFSTPVTNLSMMDVRFSVAPDMFQQYLAFFSKYLRAVRTKDDGGVGMHTDGTSFVNIPYWSDSNTELYTVTILTAGCIIPQSSYSKPIADVLDAMATVPGCNARSVSNETLISTLRQDATINTTQPLLIRLVSNVTLGANLESPIVFARPVVIVGASSAPVSVDLQMVVNQFNVTRRNAQLSWQAVVLENLAPGDAVSASMAAPYSTTVTTNLWSVFCNRSRDMCVLLTNVTLVIPSADEISYLTFMSTMYNSPSPSLREQAGFYVTDLKMTAFDIAPTSTTDSMKVLRLVTNAWNMWYCTEQTQPVFAPPLPAPRQVFNQLQYRTGVLVQTIQDCSSFQSTQGFAPNRVHVWQLAGNISIGGPNCTWSPALNISGPTTLIGDISPSTSGAPRNVTSMREYPLVEAVPAGTKPRPTANSTSVANVANNSQPESSTVLSMQDVGTFSVSTVYALGFQYTANLIHLPGDAPDRHLQIRNITLRQLPQAHAAQVSSAGSSLRRLLQGAPRAANMVPLSTDMPPGSLTILLWPFNRTLSGTPVTIADSQLLIPQPEWELIAQAANTTRNFAVELASKQDLGDLLFANVTLSQDGTVLRVGSFQGPGISGTNIRLVADPDAAAAMPDYQWPASAAAALSGSHSIGSSAQQGNPGLPVAAQAAIGACLGVLGALAVLAAGLLIRRRCKRQHARQHNLSPDGPDFKQLTAAPLAAGGRNASGGDGPGTQPRSLPIKGLAAGEYDPDGNDLRAGADQGAPGSGAASAADRRQHGVLFVGGSSCSNRGEAVPLPAPDSISEPLPFAYNTPGSTVDSRRLSDEAPVATPSALGSDITPATASPRQLSEAEQLEATIAQGLQQWNDAVSLQTIKLMQQRLQASSLRSYPRTITASTTASSTQCINTQPGSRQAAGRSDTSMTTVAAAAAGNPASSASNTNSSQDLQLFEVIGTGSFGAVHLGSWRGKQVAVKVMHLPAHAFAADSNPYALLQQAQQQTGQQGRQQHMRQQNSRPHMAIMEAVLSTNLHHPNVVQVYTYMLSPLMASRTPGANSAAVSRQGSFQGHHGHELQQQQEEEGAADGQPGNAAAGSAVVERQDQITGWQLQLVMEWCNEGTLRDQLDRRLLPHLPHSSFLHPAVAVALSHDIAAAMMHLHREGIVHGDLKAGNVLLQASTTVSRGGSMEQKQALLKVWTAAGCLPLVAKVADFGLALPLGPTDTHATLHARGTPTHMAPELFTSGHISKSSDVYAFGILLYEIVTGQRAYAGVPISLLPHRVAVEGLRPTWPSGVHSELMRLAESCWVEKPQRRPSFQDILARLDAIDTAGSSSTAAVTGPVTQLSGVQAPTAAAVAAVNAAAAKAHPLPPLPNKPTARHRGHAGVAHEQQHSGRQQSAGQQQQQPGQQQQQQGMEWSEVSYGHYPRR